VLCEFDSHRPLYAQDRSGHVRKRACDQDFDPVGKRWEHASISKYIVYLEDLRPIIPAEESNDI
jgi:hypothetical protein